MNSHAQMLEVIAAHRDGKRIQWRDKKDEPGSVREWTDTTAPLWNFPCCEYRIKPEPVKAREWTLVYLCGQFHALLPAGPHPFAEGFTGIHVREVLPPTAEGE